MRTAVQETASQTVLRNGSKEAGGRTYLYVIWVKGEFMQSSTYLTKRFSASFEELMSP